MNSFVESSTLLNEMFLYLRILLDTDSLDMDCSTLRNCSGVCRSYAADTLNNLVTNEHRLSFVVLALTTLEKIRSGR